MQVIISTSLKWIAWYESEHYELNTLIMVHGGMDVLVDTDHEKTSFISA